MAKLYFRYGAMGCGKSAALLQVAYNYNSKGMNVVLIKSKTDIKAGSSIESRIGLRRTVDYLIPSKSKISRYIDLSNINAIIVDEAQFLSPSQVDELYKISKLNDIPVLCYGLRCDFKMNAFPGSKRLLEIADEIEELKTICKCGKKATQNMRLKNGKPIFSGEQVLIDGSKDEITYEAVCGKCYLKAKEKFGEEE